MTNVVYLDKFRQHPAKSTEKQQVKKPGTAKWRKPILGYRTKRGRQLVAILRKISPWLDKMEHELSQPDCPRLKDGFGLSWDIEQTAARLSSIWQDQVAARSYKLALNQRGKASQERGAGHS